LADEVVGYPVGEAGRMRSPTTIWIFAVLGSRGVSVAGSWADTLPILGGGRDLGVQRR
jgi:hypothetical protein